MSVAIIVDTFPRWSERFIARELNELQRRGLDFTIYCLKAGDSDCERDPEFEDLIARRVVLPSCFLPSFARELGMDEAAKERMRLVEKELGITAFRQIGCADSLTKLIRERRHQIVYAHFASLPSTLGWLAAEALKLPLVISCHARDVFVEAQLLREKLQCARRVFTCNSKAFDELCTIETRIGLSGKTMLMHHGLPLERYSFNESRRDRFESDENLHLLAAGRLVPKKGFDMLIDALARPELENCRIQFALLGDGPQLRALQMRVLSNKLKCVALRGRIVGEKLEEWFNWADVLAVPSVEIEGDSDGVPNVLLESFALGLPVIGTDAGSLSDVLNVKTGFVVKAESNKQMITQNLALGICEMRADPAAIFGRAEAARAVIEERYDIRKNIEPLLKELTTP